MKYYLFYRLLKNIGITNDIPFLVAALLECAIISLIIALIAKKTHDEDFGDWFKGTFVVVAIIEIIWYMIQ